MRPLEIGFWTATACVLYTYAVYPLAMAVLARVRGRPIRLGEGRAGSCSVVISAYNEEAAIGRRLDEFAALIAASGGVGEVIVVSDGSTDRTAEVARERGVGGGVRVIDRAENRGKAASLNEGCAAARNEVVVFADARQIWAPDALARLLENFHDPAVGAASGELILETAPGVMAGLGLYWRYEKWLRKRESQVHSTVGVTGAISAVRRELFRPIPPGTILDDVHWPLRVAMQGRRVVFDGRARAFDRLPDRPRDEFRRKVRTLSGNFQLLARLPTALLPWRDPVWFQLISHKVLRLVVPWALLLILAASLPLARAGMIYRAALAAQAAFYLAGLAGIGTAAGSRLRPASAAASFLVLNAAAWLAFWVWVAGRSARSWGKVAYDPSPQASP